MSDTVVEPTPAVTTPEIPTPPEADQAGVTTTEPPTAVDNWRAEHKARLLHFLQTGLYSDLTIFVGKNKVPLEVHKFLLTAGSSILENWIQQQKMDNLEIDMPGIDEHVVQLFLKFLYIGECDFKMEDALPLNHLATVYEVPDLVSQTSAKLLTTPLTAETALIIFEQTQTFLHDELKNNSLQYIFTNGPEIIKAPAFLKLSRESLRQIIEKDEFMVSNELELFHDVKKWGEEECKRKMAKLQDFTPAERLRSQLEGIVQLVRFPLMAGEEFAINVATAEILSNDELIKMLMYFLIPPDKRSLVPSGVFNSNPRHIRA